MGKFTLGQRVKLSAFHTHSQGAKTGHKGRVVSVLGTKYNVVLEASSSEQHSRLNYFLVIEGEESPLAKVNDLCYYAYEYELEPVGEEVPPAPTTEETNVPEELRELLQFIQHNKLKVTDLSYTWGTLKDSTSTGYVSFNLKAGNDD